LEKVVDRSGIFNKDSNPWKNTRDENVFLCRKRKLVVAQIKKETLSLSHVVKGVEVSYVIPNARMILVMHQSRTL
jgi:hypothetical protein